MKARMRSYRFVWEKRNDNFKKCGQTPTNFKNFSCIIQQEKALLLNVAD